MIYNDVINLASTALPSPIPISTQNPSTDTLTSTTIEWSVPSGADITNYTITYTSESGEGMENVDGSALSALLTGLTPNVDYEASITASNCAGTSELTAFSFRIQGTGEPEYLLLIVQGRILVRVLTAYKGGHPKSMKALHRLGIL